MAINYWGDIDLSKSSLKTFDNVAITEVMEDLNQDMEFYTEMKTKFIDALGEEIAVPERVMNRYSSQAVPYAEGSRPTTIMRTDSFIQQIPFLEYQENLTITARAVAGMSAEQLAAMVNAKLTSLEAKRYSDYRQAAFTNTNRQVLDSTGQYRTVSLPFYNGDPLTEVKPVPNYSFQAGDSQHYNGVAAANTITPTEVRQLLIDKVRHHNYQVVELHENSYDYYLEALGQGIFVPRQDQIGSSTEVNNKAMAGMSGTSESLYDGHIGWVYNAPVIKSMLCPSGYLMAIGISNTAGMKPFFARKHPLGLDGLQIDVKVDKNPLENTIMTDGWGFASNNRGGAAFVKVTGTTYTIPTTL